MANINEIDYREFSDVEEFTSSLLYESLKKKIYEGGETPKEEEHPDGSNFLYSKYTKENTCIFKHILLFTNDKNPKTNKTLKNILDAIKDLPKDSQPELHLFTAAKTSSDEKMNELVISDDDSEFLIKDLYNTDVLVISRLGVQGEMECEDTVKLLQDRGFLVLNPIRYSQLASDKLQTAYLLEKANIPQPRFCQMTKEILYDKKLFVQSMKSIYKEYSGVDVDKNKELDVVVKILDGHGGTGVFTCDCKKLVAILQTIFAINPEQPLIIQRKEDGDDGDIRVHVLTLRNKQVILACMKRQQLGGDFRSNVSLGAEAIPVKLTKNQEQIALNTAKISKLPWCAVDIMHLKNKNIDGNEDVVLEINASPGTSGISEVIEHNFINVLLNELQDPDEFLLQDKTAGYLESVVINFGKNSKNFLAKLDTGNSASAPTIEVGDYNIKDNKISFNIDDVKYSFDVKKHINIRAGEELYNRPVICVPELILGQRKLKSVDLAIVKNRDHKTTNCLINRDALASLGYVVHPLETHILTEEIQKVKILN